MEFQTYLKDCNCSNSGALLYKNTIHCRWCRKPYVDGGMIRYEPEHFTPIEKGFEIRAFADNDIGYDFFTKDIDGRFRSPFHPHAFTEERLIQCKFPIHSVKRLSDNSVWTVTEKIVPDEHFDTIKGFEIMKDEMYVNIGGDTCVLFKPLNSIKKLPTKKILGTTHDGKVCYEGDLFPLWAVNEKLDNWVLNVATCTWCDYIKYFADKGKAEQYINEHKQIYSLQNIKEACEKRDFIGCDFLIQKLKSIQP